MVKHLRRHFACRKPNRDSAAVVFPFCFLVSMIRSVAKTVVAMSLWALLHSLLATERSKRRAAQLLGEQRRNGLYRIGYNGIAAAATAGTLLYIHRLPDRRLYKLKGVGAFGVRLAQLAFAFCLLAAIVEVGVGPLTGFTEVWRFLRGRFTEGAPEAQGPSMNREGPDAGGLRTGGPFGYVRHPLNASATAMAFLTQEMTVVRLTVALATLAYALIGSRIEERRLLDKYGEAYRHYVDSGVPFFLPSLRPRVPPVLR